MRIGNTLDLPELAAAPAAPPAGRDTLYFKSGGLYFRNSSGVEVGPLVSSTMSQLTVTPTNTATSAAPAYSSGQVRLQTSYWTGTAAATSTATLEAQAIGGGQVKLVANRDFQSTGDVYSSNVNVTFDAYIGGSVFATNDVRADYLIAEREYTYPASDLEAGRIHGNKLRLDSLNLADGTIADASLTSTTHGLQIGTDDGVQLRMDANEIISLDARPSTPGAPVGSPLLLQKDTGSYVIFYDEGFVATRMRPVHLYLGNTETYASTAWGNLTTVGPQVNFVGPPSGEIQIRVGCGSLNSTAGAVSFMGYQLHVNTTRKDAAGKLLAATTSDPVDTVNFGAPADSRACYSSSTGYTYTSWFGDDSPVTVGAQYLAVAKYRVTAGTATFRHRRISVQANS